MGKPDWSNLAPFVSAVKNACTMGVSRMAERLVTHVQDSFPRTGKFAASSVGSPPSRKTNFLANSITYRVISPVAVRVGPTIKYGVVHEFGWTIRPKSKKYLRVPVNEAAKTLNASQGTQSLYSIGKFRVFKSKKGNLIAIGEDKVRVGKYDAAGKRKNYKDAPVFVLKKSVRIPKRPFMKPALDWAKGNEQMSKAFVKGINFGLSQAGFSIKVRSIS